RLLGAVLVVDLADNLVLVVNVPSTKRQFAARIVCLRQAGGNFHCHGTEQRRIDTVVHKRSSQRDLPAGVAGRRGERSEIAGEHRSCWNELPRIGRVLTQRRALITAKEK